MKNYLNYIKLNETTNFEKEFLELAHIDKLIIKFVFIRYNYNICFYYNNVILFEQDNIDKKFYINKKEIWSIFQVRYTIVYEKTKSILTEFVNNYFKLNNYYIGYI